jgi:hypothetical protein
MPETPKPKKFVFRFNWEGLTESFEEENTFVDNVIETFPKKERRLYLMYK